MKTKKYRIPAAALLGCLALGLSSCDDLFEPADENIRDIDAMYKEPTYAQGILANAYILMPYSSTPGSDLATDDAVTNDFTSDYVSMATGKWTSQMDPLSQWQNRYNAIQYINILLDNIEKVKWSDDEMLNLLFGDLFRGDALGMRALQMFYLLRAHAGMADGEMLGVPILTNYLDATANFNLTRDSFRDCIKQIMSDIDQALDYLPYEYGEVTASGVPQKYATLGITDAKYNRAFGTHQKGKICGQILQALKAQVALFAASPAYAQYSDVTMQDAAAYAATVIKGRTLAPQGHLWYANTSEIDGLKDGYNSSETIWRDNVSSSNTMESDYYPPSLYGKGRINPSQNLVDAFPMANGFPITDSRSGYNSQNPYANRDPRLKAYILTDGDTYGINDLAIVTGTYGTTELDKLSGINYESGVSTRTGYYLKKLLRPDVNLSSSSSTTQNHYNARIRYTELFLDYAEAANEAYGPTTPAPGFDRSAYDIIKAIRARAGITNDLYVEECKASADKMRELIRNERRLELCFENHRFYDLRRWQVGLDALNATAAGMEISQSGATLEFKRIEVEKRAYKSHQFFGPIPYSELLKFTNLKQNEGW